MKNLIAYFIRYEVSGNVLMILLFIFGFFGLKSLKSNFFPETESRIIQIQVVYPGSSPEEIEEGIILKIEDNLKGVSGIERISSVSKENVGNITVEALKGYETDLVLRDVENAVDRISSFPVGMEPPVIFKQENLGFAFSFALSGEVNLQTLKKYGRKIEEDLRGVEGISKVEISGFPAEEIEVGFKENALRAYQITFEQAVQTIASGNIEITGGTIKGSEEEMLIRARSKNYYADGLKDLYLKTTPDGTIVHLSDVAEVKDVWADSPDRSYLNGKPSVVITLRNTLAEDLLFVADYGRRYVEGFNESNDVVKATLIRDGSVTVQQRIDLLTKNGLIGFFLVLLFLSLFLNLRLAFWVALSIPVSFAGMFILAAFFGLTINVMSLFGMILVIGILVDDGIIIGESIYQEYEKGVPRIQAAINGTMTVLPAVVSAVLTTVVAFCFFFFQDGRLGDFAPDLAFVTICTLLFSLIEGALILPAHIAHSKALSPDNKPNRFERGTSNIMKWLRDKTYAPLLRFALANRFFTFSIAISLLVITIGSVGGGIIRTTFFPPIENDDISISLEMPAGTRDQVTQNWLDHVESSIWKVNEKLKAERPDGKNVVINVQKKVGPGINNGSLEVNLLDGEIRQLKAQLVANAIREQTGVIPGAKALTFGTRTPFGKPVSVSLLGNDLKELEGAKNELKAAMQNLSSLRDVVDNDQKGIREVNIRLKEKAWLLGLNTRQVMAQIRQGFFGGEAQRLQRGIDEVKVWVRYDEEDRSSIGKLENMRIRLNDGREFPLSEIAEYSIERGVLAINHLDGRREIKVEAEMATPDLSASDITAEVKNNIAPSILAKYPSITALYEGQNRESMKSANSAQKTLPVVGLLMLAIIIWTFRSLWQGIALVFTIPFGFIGVAWGHYFHGAQISLLSFFGIIALVGIMVNDSLVYVSTLNQYLKKGMKFKEAIYEAGVSRFRPIILTSVTTIAGLGPLIMEKSFQAQFLIPMAIAVAYGLFVATFITLLLLPVLLSFFNDLRVSAKWLFTGKEPSQEEVEPAVIEMKYENEQI